MRKEPWIIHVTLATKVDKVTIATTEALVTFVNFVANVTVVTRLLVLRLSKANILTKVPIEV
jgi:hypothetical protein